MIIQPFRAPTRIATGVFLPISEYLIGLIRPLQQISTKFNLFDWYEIPATGVYTIQVFYQADEKLVYKPDGLCEGIFGSDEKSVNFK